jgi:LysR family transcriptional regulator, low CO2-responsive transcriptional regulator
MLLNRIELFVTVAEYQNLAATARKMHVSPSSVCQRLKSLERDFGAKLYEKHKNGIELTEAGRTLLTSATEILGKLNDLKSSLSSTEKTAVHTLAVGGTYNPSAKYLPSAIAALQSKHPNIKVTFLTSDRLSIEKSLRQSKLDIAIILSPSESLDFHMEHFAVDNLTFFAAPKHPLARKKRLTLKDLADKPVIVREGKGSTEKMLKELKNRGINVNVVLRCESPNAVKAAVQRGMGIGILFCDLVEDDIARKDLKTLKFSGVPKLVGHSYIVYSKNTPLSSAATEFLSILRSMKNRFATNVKPRQTDEQLQLIA